MNSLTNLKFALNNGSNFQQLRSPSFQLESTEGIKFRLDQPQEHLGVFARRYETSAVLSGLPVFAVAELGVVYRPPKGNGGQTNGEMLSPQDELRFEADASDFEGPLFPPIEPTQKKTIWNPRIRVPLGMLCTDHVGYASFDLGSLRGSNVTEAIGRVKAVEIPEPPKAVPRLARFVNATVAKPEDQIVIGLTHLWVMPFGDDALQVDAITDADIGPSYMTLRLELDEARLLGRLFKTSAGMPSMQNPGILDYKLSPASFSIAPGVVFGGDGSCESLMPSNLSSQTFRFYQLARAQGPQVDSKRAGSTTPPAFKFRLGYLFDYTTEWFPIGHSLGSLAYSLPLAPGEMVKLAIVDWSRSDGASRGEDTQFSESLKHNQLRDRSITETVSASLDEWQRGGSVMGGIAASGSYAGAGYSLGGAAALGGGYSTTSGSRDLTGSTTQQISDAFAQSSSAMRELRSTVVVQSEQEEKSTVQTRIVANYNHGHALTMLYYEVLRHYRVVTRMVRSRPALLIDESQYGVAPNFYDRSFLLKYRFQFETILLDQTLKPNFDAVARNKIGDERYNRTLTAVRPVGKEMLPFTSFKLELRTGPDGDGKEGGTDGALNLNLVTTTSNEIHTYQILPPLTSENRSDPRHLENEGDPLEANQENFFVVVPSIGSINWKDLRSFWLMLHGGDAWGLAHLKLTGTGIDPDTKNMVEEVLHDSDFPGNVFPGNPVSLPINQAPPLHLTSPFDFMQLADVEAENRLIDHLEANKFFYARQIWLNENINERSVRFDGVTVGNSGYEILDIIENKAVEISGRWVGYPLIESKAITDKIKADFKWEPESDPAVPGDVYTEQLLSLPTRGVFAEAKLGHCNANEVIDNTRFWDWQKSPIPYQAPEITRADAGSRYQPPQGLAPTQFPQSIVNIVTPSALPDPKGLAGALDVLKTSDIFRDQSTKGEVGTLLGKLSDNATALAAGAQKSADRQALMDKIRQAPELSKEQKGKLLNDLLTSEVADTRQDGKKDDKPKDGDQDAGANGSATGSGKTGTTPSTTTPSTKTDPKDVDPPSTGSKVPNTTPPKTTKPNKPKLPTPVPVKGLSFLFTFINPRVATTPHGKVNVTIKGAEYHTSAVDEGSTATTPPSKTIRPEHFFDMDMDNGSVWLRTKNINGEGTFSITVFWEFDLVNRTNLINEIVKMTSTSNYRPTFETQTLPVEQSFEKGKEFFPKSDGTAGPSSTAAEVLQYVVKPEFTEHTVEFERNADVENEFSANGAIKLIKDFFDVQLGYKQKEGEAGSTKVILSFKQLSSGLLVDSK